MEGVRRIDFDNRRQLVEPPTDARVAALAARQHGVVARRQLRALGLTASAIDRRVWTGRLHVVHRGVYAVGHPVLDPDGGRIAAVLACGPGAALSHASAGSLWGLRESWAVLTDVTVPRAGGHKRPRLRIHRARDLRADEVTTHRAIPVTTPARTILDLAATLRHADLEHLLDRNEILELTDYPTLAALARAHPGHRGAYKLQTTMNTHDAGTTLTRSSLERLFLALCDHHRLPRPKANTTVAGKEVDFLFEHARLIVETDSWRYHKTRRAFENDRARDAITTAAGYRTLRFTDRRLTNDPAAVAAAIAATLAKPDSGPRTTA